MNNQIDIQKEGSLEITDLYMKEILDKPVLSAEEEKKQLQKIAQGDDEAREEFIESNLKLVVSIAKQYQGRGLSLLDLIQEGNIGLLTAIDRFDISKENRFSTYASYWIKDSITSSIIDKGREIRVPKSMYSQMTNYRNVVTKLECLYNRTPKVDEIAKEMNLPVQKVINIHRLQDDMIRLNAPVGDSKDEFEVYVPDSTESIEDSFLKQELRNQVRSLLEECNLTDREMNVLFLRYGFYSDTPMTHKEVGEIYGLSKQMAQVIEQNAFTKIRKSKKLQSLSNYMDDPDSALSRVKEYNEKAWQKTYSARKPKK